MRNGANMAFGIFKSGDELYDQGLDLIKRKEYRKAGDTFEKSIEKGCRDPKLAGIFVLMVELGSENCGTGTYNRLADALDSSGIDDFEFGLTSLNPSKLSAECRLASERNGLLSRITDRSSWAEVGQGLLDLARKYQVQIGNDGLRIPEMFRNDTTATGMRTAFELQAMGYETLSKAAVMSDPTKAAEMLQTAYNYRRQMGEDGSADLRLIQSYSKSAKCWICGRTATGEGVHFVPMSSDVTPFMRSEGDGILRSAPESYESVYVCRPCYSAISRRSDDIAGDYYNKAIAELRATEGRLMAEIESVRMYALTMRR